MSEAVHLTEADIRAAIERFGEVVPGVANEHVAEQAIAALKGELVLKDAHGITDDAMEAIYALGYNAFQAGNFDAAHNLFVFLCTFDHLTQKYWMALGACRFAMKEYDGASGAYAIAAFADASDPKPALRAADCYLAAGEAPRAVAALKCGIGICGDRQKHMEAKTRAEGILDLLTSGAAETAQCLP